MALETLELDAAASNVDGTNPGTALVIQSTTANYLVTAASFPSPAAQYQYASSVDTEGSAPVSRRHENRVISLTIEALDSSSSSTREDALRDKFSKIVREGGTLKRTRKDGAVRIYDLLSGDQFDPVIDVKYENGRAEFSVVLGAKPYPRGASVLQADRIETTLPCLIATETGITGDWSATGVWTIDNDAAAGNDWWGLLYGIEQNAAYTFTDSTGSGALHYEAESRLPLGGSATAVGPSGASGAGSNVLRNTALTTTPVAIMSTASSGGTHLTHVGQFNVWARVQAPTTNAGTVTLAFEYSVGDFRVFTRTDARHVLAPARTGTWWLLNLGQVTVPKVLTGVQRWEGRVVVSSTVASDDIDIDFLELQPVGYRSGMAQGVVTVTTPTVFGARDEFDQVVGALTGKTAAVGGVWAGAGDADDFTVETTGHTAQRIATADSTVGEFNTGRWVRAGSSMTSTLAQVDVQYNTGPTPTLIQGVVARYVDTSNFAIACVVPQTSTQALLTFGLVVAGVLPAGGFIQVSVPCSVSAWHTIRFAVDAGGRAYVWFGPRDQLAISPQITLRRVEFATGGVLASGTCGFFDSYTGAVATTRSYDNFAAWVPPVDAAVFAGQSLQVRSDGVIREDSTGTFWQGVSDFEGNLLRVPNAGAEARSTRFFAKPLYHPEDASGGSWLDDRIDDISGRLTYDPRFLT